MKCFRCGTDFTWEEIKTGLLKPVLVDGLCADICCTCVKLILKEFVIKRLDENQLKVS